MKVRELRTIHKDYSIFFRGKYRRTIRPGTDSKDGEQVSGLQMTLDPRTGVISLDAPGESALAHISWAIPILDEASIPLKTKAAEPDEDDEPAPSGTEFMELADLTAYKVGDRFKSGDNWAEVVALDRRRGGIHYELVGAVERSRRRGAPPKQRLTKEELAAAQGFDPDGDDLDDGEIEGLLQGDGGKKKKGAVTRGGKKVKVAAAKKKADMPILDPYAGNEPSTGEDDDEDDE